MIEQDVTQIFPRDTLAAGRDTPLRKSPYRAHNGSAAFVFCRMNPWNLLPSTGACFPAQFF